MRLYMFYVTIFGKTTGVFSFQSYITAVTVSEIK